MSPLNCWWQIEARCVIQLPCQGTQVHCLCSIQVDQEHSDICFYYYYCDMSPLRDKSRSGTICRYMTVLHLLSDRMSSSSSRLTPPISSMSVMSISGSSNVVSGSTAIFFCFFLFPCLVSFALLCSLTWNFSLWTWNNWGRAPCLLLLIPFTNWFYLLGGQFG